MSVINKVLRDLDQRQAASTTQSANVQTTRDQVMRGTLPLAVVKKTSPRRWWFIGGTVVVLLLVGLTTWSQMSSRGLPTPEPDRYKLAQPAALVLVPPIQAASAPVLTAAANLAVTPVPPSAPSLTASATAVAKTSLPVIKSTPPIGTQPILATAKSTGVNVAPAAVLASAVAMPPATQAKPANDGLQQAANQALAQAQAMWSEGSRASAIDLLRQALGRLEASNSDSLPSASSASVAALVRELARMELAEAQVSQALKLLVRLEPQIDQVADLWAMRGNAAQRLGQHTEAASSYQRALNLKPEEPRWMLGLAVSLAAQGQTVQAGDMAERVRRQGALRPEIAIYLRQLGVVIGPD